MIIHFPNSPSRRIAVYEDKARVIRQLCLGSIESVVNTLLQNKEWQSIVYDKVFNLITTELTGLCVLSEPSLLRQKAKEDLVSLKRSDIYDEMSKRCPLFLKFLLASVSNPSQSRNVHKKGEALHPPMLDAGCQLISVFSSDLDATRRVKSIVLKKGGLKKTDVKRLASLYTCYNSTNTLMEKLGQGYDSKLVDWKEEVELGVKREVDILESLKQAQTAENENQIKERAADLHTHRASMHQGYSFTGDNVDMRCTPQQMTLKNRNKDHHMFQIVAFKNRVSSNHLPSHKPKGNVNEIPFATFLPSSDEQSLLQRDLVVLVRHKWASIFLLYLG